MQSFGMLNLGRLSLGMLQHFFSQQPERATQQLVFGAQGAAHDAAFGAHAGAQGAAHDAAFGAQAGAHAAGAAHDGPPNKPADALLRLAATTMNATVKVVHFIPGISSEA